MRASKEETPTLAQALMRTFMNSNLGVYSEVRGKYARPAPQLNHVVKNPVLNRPTTAGSLRPKTSHGSVDGRNQEGHGKVDNQTEDNNVIRPHSSMDFTKRPSSRRSRGSSRSHHRIDSLQDYEKKSIKVDEKILNSRAEREDHRLKNPIPEDHIENREKTQEKVEKTQEKDEKIQNNEEKSKSEVNELENIEEEGKNFEELDKVVPLSTEQSTSRASWRTTSSQRRYICELETLLREEKLKRIRLEELLQSIISK